MKAIIPGYVYELDDGTVISFPGVESCLSTTTTTCELIDVLVHRINSLNKHNPCDENPATVNYLLAAKELQQARKRRIEEEKNNAQKH
jgi:putative NIF3 family GTP cyclohydrolase 1 type 2